MILIKGENVVNSPSALNFKKEIDVPPLFNAAAPSNSLREHSELVDDKCILTLPILKGWLKGHLNMVT
jgi:hypothetical protein